MLRIWTTVLGVPAASHTVVTAGVLDCELIVMVPEATVNSDVASVSPVTRRGDQSI